MEDNKYYIPEIEEFHVGFEYEWLDIEVSKYHKREILDTNNSMNQPHYLANQISDGEIRVKYLDKEDIKSVPLSKTKKNQWIGFEDYYSGDVNPNYGYYLYFTLHVPKLFNKSKRIEDNLFKIILHRYYNETIKIDEQLEQGESKVVFEGIIKNKSKLKDILINQLQIIK